MFISGPVDAVDKILARYRGTMLVSRQGSESAHGAGELAPPRISEATLLVRAFIARCMWHMRPLAVHH